MGDFFDSGFDEAGASADYTVPDDDTSTHGSGIDDFDTSAHTTTTAFEADHMSQMPTVDELLHTPTSPEVPVPELDDPAPVPPPAPPAPPVDAPPPAAPPAPDLGPDFGPDFPPPPEPDFGPDPAAPPVLPDTDPELPTDGISGNPTAYTDNWFWQETDGVCVPSAEAQVISEYTGMDISDPQQLADRAVELGLFPDGDTTAGMTMDGAEILMEDQGVPCHQEQSSMADLDSKLSAGYGVIAFVDSGEIWSPGDEPVEDDTPDHALVVAGIDHDRGVVILSDPGSQDGNQEEVPIDQFADAWADSGNAMLVPNAPDPDLANTGTDTPDLAALDRPAWAMLDLTKGA